MKRIIHWFRRDLRLTDNIALHAAASRGEEVISVYITSPWTGHHNWTGPSRQSFLCGCLASLHANLQTLGSGLVIRRGDTVQELEKLVVETGADAVFFNLDPDPFGLETEARLRAVGEERGFRVLGFADATIRSPDEVLTGDGSPYRVYTPYAKSWMKMTPADPLPRVSKLKNFPLPKSDSLPTLETWGWSAKDAAPDILPAGEKAARARLAAFLKNGIQLYGRDRNIPAGRTTSRLSQDLRFGLIGIRETVRRVNEVIESSSGALERTGAVTYLRELIWREFYFAILAHYPSVLDWEFNEKHRGLAWHSDDKGFEAWKFGRTGFPIVDAAMRELLGTGFMHNRCRMIAAMFLTKDLHLDWRLGEKWFMQQLVDGEIACNNGGWQWSAGTGADAAPYFRIQNPWTQSLRFDPDGTYIRQWVPELAKTPVDRLHKAPEDGRPIATDYPLPILDHSHERGVTLDMFRVPG